MKFRYWICTGGAIIILVSNTLLIKIIGIACIIIPLAIKGIRK